MAKKQSRRTISMQRALYDLVHAAASTRKVAASKWLHEACAAQLAREGVRDIPAHGAHPDPQYAAVAKARANRMHARRAVEQLRAEWGM
jgi:hypothetical protein